MVELGIALTIFSILFSVSSYVAANRVVENVKRISNKTVENISSEAIKENARLNMMINGLVKDLEIAKKRNATPRETIERAFNAQAFINDLKLIQDKFAIEKEKPTINAIISRIKKQYVGN